MPVDIVVYVAISVIFSYSMGAWHSNKLKKLVSLEKDDLYTWATQAKEHRDEAAIWRLGFGTSGLAALFAILGVEICSKVGGEWSVGILIASMPCAVIIGILVVILLLRRDNRRIKAMSCSLPMEA